MPKSLKLVFQSVTVLALMLLAPSLASAQTDVSAGYQFAHVSANGLSETYPVGGMWTRRSACFRWSP
jgi:hypothetical protein